VIGLRGQRLDVRLSPVLVSTASIMLGKNDLPASGLKAHNIVLPLHLLQQSLVLLLLLWIALLQHCQVISTHAQQPLNLP